jgi:hypothetical protein
MRVSAVRPGSLQAGQAAAGPGTAARAQPSHREAAQQGSITASEARSAHSGHTSSAGRGGMPGPALAIARVCKCSAT